MTNAGAAFANFARILAGAVASSLDTAIALGPFSKEDMLSKSVPLNAKFINVFCFLDILRKL